MPGKRLSQKEANAQLVAIMKEWQKIEAQSIESIQTLTRKVKNPLVRQVFQIIAHDSAMHKRVEEFIVDSLEKEAITLTPEELSEIWSTIEEHIEMEKATALLGERARTVTTNFIHRYLLNYLLVDERKHDALLEQLENIKNRIYPYA